MKLSANSTVLKPGVRIVAITFFILLLPLLAMQFTDEVAWNLVDFAIAGVLLLGAGLMYELGARRMNRVAYRAAVAVAVTAALLLVWINLAVGIIGNEGNPANLMYLGVLVVGIIGAIRARLQPQEMSQALFATATAQILVAIIVLAAQLGFSRPTWPIGLLIMNGFFSVLWLASGLLFRRAAHRETEPVVLQRDIR